MAGVGVSVKKDFHELNDELGSLLESIQRSEVEKAMKEDELDTLKRQLAIQKLAVSVMTERLHGGEVRLTTKQNTLQYKQTLLETFNEGLDVKSRSLGIIERAIQEQTKRMEILKTRKSVARYCVDARDRQIKLLEDSVAGALVERSAQKEALADFHERRLVEQEQNYKVKVHRTKWDQTLLTKVFSAWTEWTQLSLRAKRLLRGTMLVWKMRRAKTIHRLCFTEWRAYIQQKRAARQKLVLMTQSSEHALARLFMRWHSHIKAKNDKAYNHQRNKALSKVFGPWRKYLLDKNQARQDALARFRQMQRERFKEKSRNVLQDWQYWAETTRRNRNSVHSYDTLAVAKTFKAWRGVLKLVQDRKTNDEGHRLAKMGFMFRQWRVRAKHRALMRKSLHVMQHSVEARVFRSLQRNVVYQRIARRGIGRLKQPIQAKAFSKWRAQVQSQKLIREKFATINAPSLKTALAHWRKVTKFNKSLRGMVVRLQQPLVSKALNAWKAHMQEQRKWTVLAKAFQEARLRQCLQALRITAAQAQDTVLFAKRRAPIFTMRFFLQKWLAHTKENKMKRKVVHKLQATDLTPFLQRWRKNVRVIKIGREYLARYVKVLPVFQHWRAVARGKPQAPPSRHSSAKLRKVFAKWSDMVVVARFCTNELMMPTVDCVQARPLHLARNMPPSLWPVITKMETASPVMSHKINGRVSAFAPRHGHCCVSVDNGGVAGLDLEGVVYVFGGQDQNKFMGDLLVMDLYGCVVSSTQPSTGSPAPRSYCSFHLLKNNLIVHGGLGMDSDMGATVFGDLWTYSLTTHQWQMVSDASEESEMEVGRCYHASCTWGDNLWVFCGLRSDFTCTDNVLRYSFATGTWVEDFCTGQAPSPRCHASHSVFRNSLFLFGGTDAEFDQTSSFSQYNDLYQFQFEFRTWTRISTMSSPSPRQRGSLVAWRNKLCLIGGCAGSSLSSMSPVQPTPFLFDPASQSWSALEVDGPLPNHTDGSGILVGQSSVLLVGGYDAEVGAECGDMYRVDLQRDTLQLLRPGAPSRIGLLLDDDVDKAIMCLLHVCRNVYNRDALSRTRVLVKVMMLAVDHTSVHQASAFEILASYCTPAASDMAVQTLFVKHGVFGVAVDIWQAKVANLMGNAMLLVLWIGSSRWLAQELFASNIGLEDILRETNSPHLRIREQARATLKAMGLTRWQSGSKVRALVQNVTSIKDMFAMTAIDSVVAASLAAEALVLLSCDARNRDAFFEYFEQEGAKGMALLFESERSVLQRCGCCLARWLSFASPEFPTKLEQVGCAPLILGLRNSSDVSIASSARAVCKYFAEA